MQGSQLCRYMFAPSLVLALVVLHVWFAKLFRSLVGVRRIPGPSRFAHALGIRTFANKKLGIAQSDLHKCASNFFCFAHAPR